VKFNLTAKDLINVGVFTVLYIAVVAVFGQLGALVPILQVLGPLYMPALAGIVFMLFLTRVGKPGMVTIMGVLVGLLVLATGQAFWVLVLAVVLAPLADLILSRGGYKRWATTLLGYIVFSEMLIGTVIPLFFARDAYLARIGKRKDAAWIESIIKLTPTWMFAVMIVELAVGAVVGAFLGRALLKKHFERAGIA
jgi:energy-coupling factor transport system substrate-specific component